MPFHRIYWKKEFDWETYAELYNKYCKSKDNYYALSSEALIPELKGDELVVDLACGTGALTQTLLRKYPNIRIIAIDISKEAIKHYKENFSEQIKNSQIRVLQENAEQINTETVDFIFIPSALWDMELKDLFKSLVKIMKPNTKIITNLPYLTLGKEKGFIHEIENIFKEEANIKKFYRRIFIEDLEKILKKNRLMIEKIKEYKFFMPKDSVNEFFDVLNYRYPFIFFEEDISYEERFKICKRIFQKLLDKNPNGMEESGEIVIISHLPN